MSDHEQQPLHGWVLAGAVTMLVSLLGIAIVLSLGISQQMSSPLHHGALFLLELAFSVGLIVAAMALVKRAIVHSVTMSAVELARYFARSDAAMVPEGVVNLEDIRMLKRVEERLKADLSER